MTKRRNSKINICTSIKIKDLAQEIYYREMDEVICLLTELDTLYSNNHDGVEWNDCLQVWIDNRDWAERQF